MTCEEFSNMFDTLLNSYASKANFGDAASASSIQLDEYEKSVLLTQAQDDVVKTYFDARLNVQGQGFDDTARRQVEFSSLIKVASIESKDLENKKIPFDSRGIIFTLPLVLDAENAGNPPEPTDYIEKTCDVLILLNERVTCKSVKALSLDITYNDDEKSLVVMPVSYKEYDRAMAKPYSQPLKKQAWRLFQNTSTGYDVDSEIILNSMIAKKAVQTPTKVGDVVVTYNIRYVSRPTPIVLVDLPDGLAVDGRTKQTECKLNPIIHIDILNRAVELAITTRGNYADALARYRQEQRQQAQRAASTPAN
jgi:hypothetical protein